MKSGLVARVESKWVVCLTILALLVLAYNNRFMLDDAFISFRYARHLATGHGLVYNLSERPVEGYTNFLWTALMSLSFPLGVDVVHFSQALGLLFALGTLVATHKLASSVLQSRAFALLGVVLLGTNYTFSAYVTGGLETQMQACLFVVSVLLTWQAAQGRARPGLHLLLSLIYSVALLTRPDSAVLLSILWLFLLCRWAGDAAPAGKRLVRALWIAVPMAAIVGCWLAWKLQYYGSLLPNTFYAKAIATSPRQGLIYLYTFLRSYNLIALVLLIPLCGGVFTQAEPHGAGPHVAGLHLMAAVLLGWSAYTVWVGGDFMEFRFFVPVLPFLFILVAALIRAIRGWKLKAVVTVAVIASSFLHAATFTFQHGIESIVQLDSHVASAGENWPGIGMALRALFNNDEHPVTIATTAAGAIPYYSELETVDMLGLNDRWIARNGEPIGSRPGHQKVASFEYLVERGVNLVIGHPQIELSPGGFYTARYTMRGLERFAFRRGAPQLLPSTARVVEIPLGDRYKLVVFYLVQNDYVDRVIREKRLVTYEIVIGME